MSKAFRKEMDSENGDDEDLTADGAAALPKNTKNYITPQGAERLKEELKNLLYTERSKLVQVIEWAASNGDRSENGDYIYGKRKLREMDRRIRFLTKRLEIAEIVDPSKQAEQAKQNSDRVLFGATVTVSGEDGKKRKYRIVGVDEIDAKNGDISWLSPIAKALLNGRVGDVVSLRTPKGEEEIEIDQIQYLEVLSKIT